ncbi:MAG: 30S ribosomal protein S7 [Candidatus Vogelbacteria bacterium CG10_big_fil_rev_8_21_14_0_10_49_38]|uniref:Small ribosomal subunit protein uS7 n=1 Tax=Candidatus Vogelbacteria bacterium CG10_big_fil_rev_8_21_14_0_10_49_38 TaxID=1975043 RepID=A0A2H0RKU0_9BACT|nr:MAG: 30S ribosomal protein S7 [bacterium CG10_49_38]PIR46405.1 MAG: 30S ribosomal protein S7 [Candidatus Vogelbacteria bacterium CG10_big_fil_rev_8_21_14_0_10_49_38]
MRRPTKKLSRVKPDFQYQSLKVEKLINYIMQAGKKNTARTVVYDALTLIKDKTKEEPLEVFETALRNVSPQVEVRSRRVGGANYQVPHEVRPERKMSLAYRWLIEAAKNKKGKPMADKLAAELIDAYKNEGEAIKKRENVHRMAEANRAFAHFARARKK